MADTLEEHVWVRMHTTGSRGEGWKGVNGSLLRRNAVVKGGKRDKGAAEGAAACVTLGEPLIAPPPGWMADVLLKAD